MFVLKANDLLAKSDQLQEANSDGFANHKGHGILDLLGH